MNAITPLQEVRHIIHRLAPEFAKALPPGVNPDRFERVCLTAIQQNEKLLECSQDSLWSACMKAAQDGLLPDGREGAIVPRWNGKKRCLEAHWMPMVAGLIAKAKRKGSVASLSAQVVYDGERFAVLLGDEDRIEHVRDIGKVQRGKEIAVYAIAVMKDGSKEREVMSWEEVQQIAEVSQKDRDGNLGAVWRTWEGEMAKKSVIRRLSKRLPSMDEGDDDLRRSIERVDELYDMNKPALAASRPALGITHQQEPFDTSPALRGLSSAGSADIAHLGEPPNAINRMSSAELDQATNGDQIPDFEPPKPDRFVRDRDRLQSKLGEARAFLDEHGHEAALASYNATMANEGVKAVWAKLRAERPELAAEVDRFSAETLERIHAAAAPPESDA